MFVSHQKNYAMPLVIYEHVYEVSSLYDIGKLGFQNPCFSTDSREIYRYRETLYILKEASTKVLVSILMKEHRLGFPNYADSSNPRSHEPL